MPQSHFVVDIEELNDIAEQIAEKIPPEFYGKYCRELREYLNCAMGAEYSTDESESDLSDLDEEVIEVEIDEKGFYTLTECDIKDCNSVGVEEKSLNNSKKNVSRK